MQIVSVTRSSRAMRSDYTQRESASARFRYNALFTYAALLLRFTRGSRELFADAAICCRTF